MAFAQALKQSSGSENIGEMNKIYPVLEVLVTMETMRRDTNFLLGSIYHIYIDLGFIQITYKYRRRHLYYENNCGQISTGSL